MKRLITAIIAVVAMAGVAIPAAHAQNFNEVYRRYRGHEDLTRIRIPKAAIVVAKWFVDEPEVKMFLSKTSSVRIMVSENAYIEKMADDSREWAFRNGFEELLTVIDDGEQVEMYVLDKNGEIRQLLLLVRDDDDEHVVLHIEGRYPLEMIRQLINDETNPTHIFRKS